MRARYRRRKGISPYTRINAAERATVHQMKPLQQELQAAPRPRYGSVRFMLEAAAQPTIIQHSLFATVLRTAVGDWCRRFAAPGMIAAAALASGCSGSSPDKQLSTVRSWTATMTFAATQRSRRAITGKFTTQLHDRAVETLTSASEQLSTSAPRGDEHAQAMAATDSLRQAIHHLAQVSAP